MNHCIIGNSAATLGAIEGIRQKDKTSHITVISDEPYPCYSRPAIAHFLSGDLELPQMYLRDEFYYSRNGVRTFFQKKVIGIDTNKKELIMEDRNCIPYDKLLISTGGTPIIPDIKGRAQKNVFTFTKLDDAKTIATAIAPEPNTRRAVVLGGGLIGLCVTEALEHLGVKVTIVELAERILKPAMDETACNMLARRLNAHGITIITSDTISELTGHKEAEAVHLKSGKNIPCDLVVVAMGVKPNIELAKNTPIKTNRGILIDSRGRTNIENIFAAGDVVESMDPLCNENRVIPIWPNAYQQGSIAGMNMAGGSVEYSGGFAMNSFAFYDLPIISVGINDPPEGEVKKDGYEILSKLDEEKNIYRKLVIKNNVVVGAIFAGDIDKSGIITYLIKNKVDVSDIRAKLLDDDFGFISFSRQFREERLEQPV